MAEISSIILPNDTTKYDIKDATARQAVTTTENGQMLSTDKRKLDAIEENATATSIKIVRWS